jgi:hypothetical protein
VTTGRPRCSTEARVRPDQLAASASHVRNWLMVEQPGAWGPDALMQSRLAGHVARALYERGHELAIRVILIRRPDRRPNGLNVFIAHCGGSRTRPLLLHGVVDDPASLLEFDLAELTAGRPVGFGTAIEGPLFLVCTNGRHDVCCAERGRPLYRSLVEEFRDETWECSHIGGDRFAGNLVCFPHGVYFGWLDPDEVAATARRYAQGAIDLDHYRGRSSWTTDIQAAEHFLRADLALTGIDDLVPRRRLPLPDDDGAEILFETHTGKNHVVVVRRITAQESVFLTCQATEPASPHRFELVSID